MNSNVSLPVQNLTAVSVSKTGRTSVKPISRKVFAETSPFALDANGKRLGSSRLRAAYREHVLLPYTQRAGASVVSTISSGESVVIGHSASKDGNRMTVTLMDRKAFEARYASKAKKSKAMTKEDFLAAFAANQGISVEDLLAAIEMAK